MNVKGVSKVFVRKIKKQIVTSGEAHGVSGLIY
jgi:hypothetical protein